MTDLQDTLRRWFKAQMETVHTALPGRIQSYDATTRTATVVPLVRLTMSSTESLDIPPIDNVPVVFPSGGAFEMTWELQQNDGVLLIFAETGIGNFLAGDGQLVDADDSSRFSLTDAIAVPGLFPTKGIPQPAASLRFTADGFTLADGKGNTVQGTDSGLSLQDANGNTIQGTSGKLVLNGNLEVLQ